MSQYLEFTPDGLLLYKWNSKKQKYIRSRPKKKTICTHLRSLCEIAEGTTLKDILNAVDKYKFLKFFVSQYSWCWAIDEFHAQVNEEHFDVKENDEEKIEYLELYWGAEVWENDFDLHTGFHGIGKETIDELTGQKYTERYSVSCTPLYEIANLPVKLNKEFKVYKDFKDVVLEGEHDYTLLEVLDAIYDDISFYGSPAESQQFLEDLKADVEEIKSGKVPLIPMQQVEKQLGLEQSEEKETKVLFSPNVAKQLGVNPDNIPLDDKEIIRPDGK